MTLKRPDTLAVFTEWAGERYGDLPALRHRREDDGAWTPVSYERLRATVRETGQGLIALGVASGDRVAILSETRVEWTYAHFAVLAAGAVVVPVYPTAGEEELAWVLGDSGASVVLVEDAAQGARVAGVRGRLPALRHVIGLHDLAGARATPDALHDLAGARATPDALLARARAVRPADGAAIVYTSGTTGPPKGVRLTHGNLGAVQDATLPLIEGGPGDRTYLYLPLAHLLAQLIQFTTLLYGGELCYFGGRIENVVTELAEAQPTHLPSVPRLFEKVHSMARAFGATPEQVREALGGRLRWALTGAAPIAPETLEFLAECGVQVFEGYGMTESGGVISLNHPGAVRYGTVGRPVAGCEVRIAGDGEVLARGPMVAAGEVADDGWLHTGDLGALDEDGFLTITGRKKDLIITSSGKNLSPSEVELLIERAPVVSHAVMAGDRRPYPVALITVDADAVRGLDADAVRALVQEAVDAANARVSRPARIRAFTVLEEDFSVADGVLTPTLKVRRKAVLERYAAEIDKLYDR
ncbi:AMP-dependent synthetase [Streptomyces sp. CB03234]|uniref:AMP-dependent synthetase/ligase n=1 Tax=Streptomyces sp. (strain CB03234) TaxID=1703937 RepID=UPI000938FE14|nr:AMP-dependent synthetase/ligase [Streptomyces sp. CB03234]OKK06892.1 AMP-dependent synthetase [Streptomyces sp. CB03234]